MEMNAPHSMAARVYRGRMLAKDLVCLEDNQENLHNITILSSKDSSPFSSLHVQEYLLQHFG
jgi:hypothetical protein